MWVNGLKVDWGDFRNASPNLIHDFSRVWLRETSLLAAGETAGSSWPLWGWFLPTRPTPIIHGVCVRRGTCRLRFIFGPQISTQGACVINCRRAHGREKLELPDGWTLPPRLYEAAVWFCLVSAHAAQERPSVVHSVPVLCSRVLRVGDFAG